MKEKYISSLIIFLLFTFFRPSAIADFLPSDQSESLVSTSPIISGAIQFPKTMSTVLSIPLYCMGMQVPTEIDSENKRLTFDLLKGTTQRNFFILITQGSEFAVRQSNDCHETYLPLDENYPAVSNTINYIRVREGAPYKLYSCDLIIDTKNRSPLRYRWHVAEQLLDAQDQRIPDFTLIIFYDPNFVEKIESHNIFELPTIVLRKDLVDAYGSEKLFRHACDEMALASIDFNTIHGKCKKTIKILEDKKRTLVAVTA